MQINLRVAVFVMLGILGQSVFAASTISLESLLEEMIDVSSIARWPAAEFQCRQASSYDRATVAPDQPGWFANDDFSQFIRKETRDGHTEHVMMESNGPGAIVRFWLTAGGNRNGALRIYLDNAEAPTLSFNGFDLLQGDLSIGDPLIQSHPGYNHEAGGSNLFLPIPYARHCKVTWEEKGQGARYYVINYREFTSGTNVKSFSRDDLQVSAAAIANVNKQLAAPPQFVAGQVSTFNEIVKPQSEVRLDLPAGSQAIRRIELRLEPHDAAHLAQSIRSMIVKIAFDNETTVWCPASDFFGSGAGINELHSWYRTVNKDGSMSCRWVMPYQKSARVSLQNTGGHPVNATLHVTTSPWRWNEHSMRFHTAWHFESGLKTLPVREWNYVTLAGRGVYVGDTLSLFNPVPTWYGEGDEKIRVDGEMTPSHLGTGTEDYYGYSYAPRGIIQTPFNNQVRVDHSMTQGHNVLTRTRDLDGIPFRQSLKFDIELISWAPTELTYAATTHWYGFPGTSSNIQPQPVEAALPIPTLEEIVAARARKIAGAIECEKLKILAKSDGLSANTQDMSPWDSTNWSNGHHLVIKPAGPGDYLELEIPATDLQPWQLVVYPTLAPDFGIVKFAVNGRPSNAEVDCWADRVQPGEPINLGQFTPDNKRFVVRIEVIGANPQSVGNRYLYGLDCFVLESVTK